MLSSFHSTTSRAGSVFGALTLAVQLASAASEARLPEKVIPPLETATMPYKLVQEPTGKTLMVGDKQFGPYAYLPPVSPVVFSPNGQHWIAFARKGDGQEVFVVDGKELKSPIPVGPNFTYKIGNDGLTWAACIQKASKESTPDLYLIMNGKVSGSYSRITGVPGQGWSPWMTANGKTTAAFGVKGQSVYTIVNGEEFGPYRNTKPLFVSPDGSFWCTCGQKDQLNEFLLVNGKEYGPYVWSSPVFMSEDGRHWGAIVGKNDAAGQKVIEIVDGQEDPSSGLKVRDLPVKAVVP